MPLSIFLRSILVMVATCLISPAFAAHAVAYAQQSNGEAFYYYAYNSKTTAVAGKSALKSCKDGAKKNSHVTQCQLAGQPTNGPAYVAIVDAKDGKGFGWGSSQDRQVAIDSAYNQCAERGECENFAKFVVFDEGQGQQKVAAQDAPSARNCQPPAGKVLRYRDQCFNGACTRTFENGCTKQFQAPYCFDPVQQKWDWKPDGC